MSTHDVFENKFFYELHFENIRSRYEQKLKTNKKNT